MSLRTTSCLASSVMVDDGLRVAMSARGSHRGKRKTSGAQNRPITLRSYTRATENRLWQTNLSGNGDLSEIPHVLTRHTLVWMISRDYFLDRPCPNGFCLLSQFDRLRRTDERTNHTCVRVDCHTDPRMSSVVSLSSTTRRVSALPREPPSRTVSNGRVVGSSASRVEARPRPVANPPPLVRCLSAETLDDVRRRRARARALGSERDALAGATLIPTAFPIVSPSSRAGPPRALTSSQASRAPLQAGARIRLFPHARRGQPARESPLERSGSPVLPRRTPPRGQATPPVPPRGRHLRRRASQATPPPP